MFSIKSPAMNISASIIPVFFSLKNIQAQCIDDDECYSGMICVNNKCVKNSTRESLTDNSISVQSFRAMERMPEKNKPIVKTFGGFLLATIGTGFLVPGNVMLIHGIIIDKTSGGMDAVYEEIVGGFLSIVGTAFIIPGSIVSTSAIHEWKFYYSSVPVTENSLRQNIGLSFNF